jgi:hypothetical protein
MTAPEYEHLPTTVEAVQWLGHFEDFPASWRASGALDMSEGDLIVMTGKGPATVKVGDYVVRSPWEEFWPIAEPKFLVSYKAKDS